MSVRLRKDLNLFLLSFAGLYLELVLIRWLSSEVKVFAYFKNFPLLAAFIGLGLGCYVAGRRPIRWGRAAVSLCVVAVACHFSERLHLPDLFFPDPALYVWKGSILSPTIIDQARGYPFIGALYGKVSGGTLLFLIGLCSFSAMALLFVATSIVFYPIGQATGQLFAEGRPLRAYSINIAGALLGSLSFTIVSYYELGPVAWMAPAFLVFAFWSFQAHDRLGTVASLGALVVAGAIGLRPSAPAEGLTVWSPYYKISLIPGTPETEGVPGGDSLGWTLRVNHDYFQHALDLRPEAQARAPQLRDVAANYDAPFKLAKARDRVLIVGSGMGNDVAAAVRAGSGHVTAVEIDPAIIRLGQALHPEHPYSDPRVTVVNNDARAYFRQSAGAESRPSFDLVVFGLLDSHAALSAMSSVRLEFYVYTEESIREALSLLDPEHGIVTISFSVGWRDWIGQRLYNTIEKASGRPPLVFLTQYDGGVTFVAGPGLDKIDRAGLTTLSLIDVTAKYAGSQVRPVSDDWPFLYLNPTRLPWVYLAALVFLLLIGSLFVTRYIRAFAKASPDQRRTTGVDLHMFLMGAAFMLVETGAIARLALVFGATWFVNAAVISAVLLMILAANALASYKLVPPVWVCYALLCLSLLALYFLPLHAFVGGQGAWLWSTLIVATPVLFAALVFAETFSKSANADMALGFNMLGALLGGALEAVSMSGGIRILGLIAVALYLLSALVLSLRRQSAGVAALPGVSEAAV